MDRARLAALIAFLLPTANGWSQDRAVASPQPVWRAPNPVVWQRAPVPADWLPEWARPSATWFNSTAELGPAFNLPLPQGRAATIGWQPNFSGAWKEREPSATEALTTSNWVGRRCVSPCQPAAALPTRGAESIAVFPRQTIPEIEPPDSNNRPAGQPPLARLLPPVTTPRVLPADVHSDQTEGPILPEVEPIAERAIIQPSANIGESRLEDNYLIPNANGKKSAVANAPVEPPNETPAPPAIDKSLVDRVKPFIESPLETVLSRNSPELWATVHPLLARLEIRDEYLVWWMRGDRVPVLAATSTTNGSGALNDPNTLTLFNSGSLNDAAQLGYRWRGLFWLDADRNWALGGGYFFLGRRSNTTEYSSDAYPTLTRPVFVLNTNQEDAETVASPGLSTGRLSIANTTSFWGIEANLLKRCYFGCDQHIDFIFGYRYLSLVERLDITENITAGTQAPDPAGTRINVQDRFHTNNAFHGGLIGVRYEHHWGRLSADIRASVALGSTSQVVEIGGNQSVTVPGQATQQYVGGLLATPTNIGHFSRNRFTVVPEVGINLGYEITPRIRAFAGYSLIYWSSVVRPGAQIDRVIDVTQVPNSRTGLASTGQQRPGVLFDAGGFWVQGVTFGLEYRW